MTAEAVFFISCYNIPPTAESLKRLGFFFFILWYIITPAAESLEQVRRLPYYYTYAILLHVQICCTITRAGELVSDPHPPTAEHTTNAILLHTRANDTHPTAAVHTLNSAILLYAQLCYTITHSPPSRCANASLYYTRATNTKKPAVWR